MAGFTGSHRPLPGGVPSPQRDDGWARSSRSSIEGCRVPISSDGRGLGTSVGRTVATCVAVRQGHAPRGLAAASVFVADTGRGVSFQLHSELTKGSGDWYRLHSTCTTTELRIRHSVAPPASPTRDGPFGLWAFASETGHRCRRNIAPKFLTDEHEVMLRRISPTLFFQALGEVNTLIVRPTEQDDEGLSMYMSFPAVRKSLRGGSSGGGSLRGHRWRSSRNRTPRPTGRSGPDKGHGHCLIRRFDSGSAAHHS